MNAPHRKPQADIYTALLALALAAVIIAAVFAYLETGDYGDQKYRGAPPVQTVVYGDPSPPNAYAVGLLGSAPTSRPAVVVG
jgi:hypothetical protein